MRPPSPVGRLAVLAIAAGSGGCGAPPDHAAAIEAVHDRILEAHRSRDPEAWTALEAETVTVASRGRIVQAGRDERLVARRRYLGSTRFSVYRDVRPPVVRVSPDGRQAWLFAGVEVVAYPDTAGATDSTHTFWAWIELYERRGDRWLLVGNVSNERPGPDP